jgi:hypothetical protein
VNGLANAVSPWLLGAFVAGATQRSLVLGAKAGVVALVVGVASYYSALLVALGDRLADVRLLAIVWLLAAVAAGAACGASGAAWRSRQTFHAMLGVAVVCAGFIFEAGYRAATLQVWEGVDVSRTAAQVAVANIALAVLLPLAVAALRRGALQG